MEGLIIQGKNCLVFGKKQQISFNSKYLVHPDNA
ncbi:hypothetical protein ES705_06645 [subsurface metagenome]